MANSVNGAFREFLDNEVNIQKQQSDKAKSSRDFLINQIKKISEDGRFLELAPQYNCFFGSFSRKTKICVLDDVDLIIGLKGGDLKIQGTSWDNLSLKVINMGNKQLINLSDKFDSLWQGPTYELNSKKVKNRLQSELCNVDQYENASIHSRQEAVTLKLKSYTWNFDIVPGFYYGGDSYNKPYYLIPNKFGKWKKTNPKLEQERLSKLNQKFNGVVLETIRLVKYWNRRGQMPNVTSYVLETMVLDYFDRAQHYFIKNDGTTEDYVDIHFKDALKYIFNNIWKQVNDSKGIQGDINDLGFEEKNKISQRAKTDYNKACNAVNAEIVEKDTKKSISIWKDIFGDGFPNYGQY